MSIGAGMQQINAAQLPALRRGTEEFEAVDRDKRRTYKVLKIRLPQQNAAGELVSRNSGAIKVSGDHVTVLDIEGPHDIGLALNPGGVYLPIEVGDVITREITELSLKAFGYLPVSGGAVLPGLTDQFLFTTTEVTIAVSFGPLYVTRDRFVPGYQGQFPVARGTATATGVTLMSVFVAPNGEVPRQILKRGGRLMIRNLHAANALFLYHGIGGDWNPALAGRLNGPDGAWEIRPGEILTLDARSRLSHRFEPFLGNPQQGYTLCLGAPAATTTPFNVMLSAWGDSSDQESDQLQARTDREYGKP